MRRGPTKLVAFPQRVTPPSRAKGQLTRPPPPPPPRPRTRVNDWCIRIHGENKCENNEPILGPSPDLPFLVPRQLLARGMAC
jgi:hypothetical protein